MKKFFGVVVIISIALAGCNNSSVEDAVSKDSNNSIVNVSSDTQNQKETKNLNDATITNTQKHTDKKIDVNGKYAKVDYVPQGQTCEYSGYELTVLNSWKLGNDLMKLDELEGNDKLRKCIISEYENMNESGFYTKQNFQYIAVKIKIKNVSVTESDRNHKIYLSPVLFNKTGDNTFTYISGANVIEHSKTPYIEDTQTIHKDSLKYDFNIGDELETTLVFWASNVDGVLKDVYMYSGFLNMSAGDGINSVADGSYMFKLNLDD